MISDEQKLLEESLVGLSPAEREQVLTILRQYAASGESSFEQELKWEDFDEIPVDIETFMHDKKYLGNGLYDGEGKFTVYPFWEETLKEIFPTNTTTAFNNVVLSGAIGIGKSFVAVICILYMLHRLLCLKDPYTYYGLQKIDKLSIAFLNITIENAKGVALSKMNELILSSEWFMSHGEMRGTTNLRYHPEKNIEFCLASSNNQIIGRCIIAAFEDEVNFSTFSDPEKQKVRMMKLITQLDARMRSRFLRTNSDGSPYLPTLNILASSKDTEQSFLDAYIEDKIKNNSKTTLIVDKPQWVVDSRKDSPIKFPVAIGNKILPNELLEKDTPATVIEEYEAKGYKIWWVPIGYQETFQQNLEEAICSIIGISTASSLKFIAGDRWMAIRTNEYQNPFIKDIITVGNGADDYLQYSNFFDLSRVSEADLKKPLFMHLDLSLSGDKTGIAGVWIDGKVPTIANEDDNSEVDYSRDLRYKVAFSCSIASPKGMQVSFEKTRNFIRWLREKGFNICLISADTYNSANILQDLKTDGFKTEIVSVDRVDTRTKVQQQYAYFKSAIFERRIKVYKDCKLLTEEVLDLERLSNGKIEHRDAGKHGSKDQCDAVCGSVWDASKYAEQYTYEYGDTLSRDVDLNLDLTTDHKQQFINNLESDLMQVWAEIDRNEQIRNNKNENQILYQDIEDGIIIL